MSELAETVRTWREAQGLSQGDLARKVGCGQATVGRWEMDASVPSPEHCAALRALGCGLGVVHHEPDRIAAAIRAFRHELGVPQHELARMVGCSQKAISYWERGETTPRDHYEAKLRDLGCAMPEARHEGDECTPSAPPAEQSTVEPEAETEELPCCRRCTAFGDPEIPLVTPAIRERMAEVVDGELRELEPGLCLWCWMQAQGIDSRQFYESGVWQRVLDWRPDRDPLMELCDEVRDAVAENGRTFLGVAHELGIPGKTMWQVMERHEVSLTREEVKALCAFAELEAGAYVDVVAG